MLMIAGLLGVMLMGAAFIGDFSGDDETNDESEVGEQEEQAQLLEDLATGDGFEGFEELASENVDEDESFDFVGWDDDDRLVGTDASETFSAGMGDDEVGPYGGDDHVETGAGDDTARGGDGSDTLMGDAGDDVLYGDAGADSVLGGEGFDSIFSNNGDDALFGSDGDDSVVGGEGDDSLDGGTGADALEGMAGADLLRGGDGADTLFGGDGNDVLIGTMLDQGGVDADTVDYLNGADGDDEIFAGSGDIVNTGEGEDTVLVGDWITGEVAFVEDFEPESDKLVVVCDDSTGVTPVIQLIEDADFPEVTYLLADGHSLAAVEEVGDLTVADIELVGSSTVAHQL